MIYDALLIISLWATTSFIVVVATGEAATGPAWQSLMFLELFAFFTFFWLYRGQTLGMLAWKLHVVNSAGSPISPGQACLRFVGALLSFMCVGLGYLWIFIDHSRRSWSDMLSGTRIIY